VRERYAVGALVIGLAFAACEAEPPPTRYLTGGTTARCNQIYRVSILDLLNAPEYFDNECVSVKGFYAYGQLFFSREHAMIGMFEDSLDVVDNPEDPAVAGEMQLACPSGYITVVARLANLPAHGMAAAEWALIQVDELSWFDSTDETTYPSRRICWPESG